MRYFIGKEGFIWFFGVIEDRNDPEQLGRVRVRCFGWHTNDKSAIATEHLPWAHSIHSNNTSRCASTPREGEWVFGFFADGDSAQHPFILGILPGFPITPPNKESGFFDPAGAYPYRINESSLNRLARGRADGTIISTRKRNLRKNVSTAGKSKTAWSEPESTFAPSYPFNHAHESESGHAFELDDTIGKERVHLAHKNGSFIEFDHTGNRVEKITKDNYTIIIGDDFVSIDGACNITVTGDCNLKVLHDLNVETSKTINIAATSDIKVRAGKRLLLEGNEVHIKSIKDMKIGTKNKLNLISDKSVSIVGKKSLSLGGKKIKNKVKTKQSIGKIIPTGSASSPSATGIDIP